MHSNFNIKKPILTTDANYTQTKNDTVSGDWNWVRGIKHAENSNPGNLANYYESTLAPWETFPAFEGEKECELVVIGGGL